MKRPSENRERSKLTPSFDEEYDKHRHVSGLAKFVILAQAAIILSFTVWTYQEYLNNVYLQEYIIGLLKTSLIANAILSLVTISVFALGTFTLLGSMSATRRQNDGWRVSPQPTDQFTKPAPLPALETVEPPTKTMRPGRRHQRKPRIDTEDIYRSMTDYANDHGE